MTVYVNVCGSVNEGAGMPCLSFYSDSVIVYVFVARVFFLITKNEMHSTNAQIIGPSKLNKLAKAVFPLSGLRHPQFGTVWFGK